MDRAAQLAALSTKAGDSTLDRVTADVLKHLVPPPRLSVSDWLDANRVIPIGYPSPFPGPWRTSRTPHLREPLDAFNDPAVETIVLHFASQIGKTELLLGTLLYAYGVDPGPGMLVLPTLALAAGVSADRLTPALKTCDVLRVGSPKSRTTDDAVYHKKIGGMPLTMCGANSPASLSSWPVRCLWCDEIDRWPSSTPEGDPLALAKQRTVAFRRRKIVLTSTPTIKGASRIDDWFERSDKRELRAPCPRCGAAFVVEWPHVRWTTGAPSTAHLECPHCEGTIEDRERLAMFTAAEWVPTAPFSGVRGYRAWAVVSSWVTLEEMVTGFLVAKKETKTLQTWVNLTRGESWEVPSEKVDGAELLLRREEYAAEVPAGVEILTAGVDTHDDRLELLVIGWGPGEESWVVLRDTVPGDPENPETWTELDSHLLRAWPCEAGGATRIQATLVDVLGHKTQAVYRAVKPRHSRRVYASIGKSGGAQGQLVTQPKSLETIQGNVLRCVVDADQVKATIYSRLRLMEPEGPGTVHFPMSVGDAFFTELTAEHLITERNKYGVPAKKWAMRPGVRRNESLDCFGMALAALRVICPTPARFEEFAAKLELARSTPEAKGPPASPARRQAPRTKGWSGSV